MLSHDYSYPEILDNSLKVAWTEREVLEGRDLTIRSAFSRTGSRASTASAA